MVKKIKENWIHTIFICLGVSLMISQFMFSIMYTPPELAWIVTICVGLANSAFACFIFVLTDRLNTEFRNKTHKIYTEGVEGMAKYYRETTGKCMELVRQDVMKHAADSKKLNENLLKFYMEKEGR